MKDTLQKGFLRVVLSLITVFMLVVQVAYGASLDITWDANTESDLAGYYVYYGTASGDYGTPIDVGDVTEYELTGLDEGVRYYVAITVYDTADNESEMSDEESGVPPDTQDPTVTITIPTSSASYSTGSSTITLGGSSSDNVGVTQVSWVNSMGGSGTASGTTSWSAPGISLQEGDNVITVTAQDAAGHTGTDIITVTYSPPDTQDPTVTITTPTSSTSYSTSNSTVSLGGTASDNVGVTQVSWANSTGGSGTATGTASWSVSSISLQEGDNVITVTARDAEGNTGNDSITVTYTPPDTQDPTITITSPTSSSSYNTSNSTVSLGGSSSDNVGVTQVSWANNRGGSGTASGTTTWSVSSISLQEGDNVITVTARDAEGNTGTDIITVTYTPPDTQDPTVTITVPTEDPGFITTDSTLTLGGSSSDNVGVTQVRWINSQGGSGTATGTIMWSADSIPLVCGEHNIITVTAEDAGGNTGIDTLTVNVGPCKPGGLVVQ